MACLVGLGDGTLDSNASMPRVPIANGEDSTGAVQPPAKRPVTVARRNWPAPLVIVLALLSATGCTTAVTQPEPAPRGCTQGPEVANHFEAILCQAGLVGDHRRLQDVLADRVTRYGGPWVLRPTERLLRQPLALQDTTERLSRGLPSNPGDVPGLIGGFLDQYTEHGRLGPLGPARARDGLPPSTAAPLTLALFHGRRILAQARHHVDQAFAAVDPEARAALLGATPDLLAELIRSNRLTDYETGDPLVDGLDPLTTVSGAVDSHALAEALAAVAALSDADFLALLRRIPAPPDSFPRPPWLDPRFEGRFLAAWRTPEGLVLVGARGPNRYGADAALIIDLGGDDVYTNNGAGPVFDVARYAIRQVRNPVGVILDLDGDDRYLATRLATQGSGVMGVGLLVDVAGDDVYSGGRLAQGAAFLGAGALVDLDGDDTYTATEFGQGAAVYGTALLFDAAGTDIYHGAKFVQGFGGPRSLAALLDRDGNDHYRAGGQHLSSYGTRNAYQAFSQGTGMGIRALAPGGVGVLSDRAGDDVYVADNFAQGLGYYLGLGVLADHRGNDRYLGARYCQGAAAHLAVGALLDRAGDDRYAGRVAANQGGAWDVAVAGLFDLGGNDRYRATELSLGAGAQNGVGLFYDAAGDDDYTGPTAGFGYGGALTYSGGRGARNVGLFLDEGGGRDIYRGRAVGNGGFIVDSEVGVFVDR